MAVHACETFSLSMIQTDGGGGGGGGGGGETAVVLQTGCTSSVGLLYIAGVC